MIARRLLAVLRRGGLTLLVALPCGATLLAQNGDRAGEEQPPLPSDLVIPAAPALSPEESLATFSVPPGFEVELVAAEPLVRDPVTATFDGEGRLWVAEMRAYMRDVDGTREDEPNGVVAVLEDLDGDGRMDLRTEFLSGLVLPRIVTPVRDGAVVLAPPDLFFARDTDGDGKADERTVIETGLGGVHSPEHAVNGFAWNLDNWYRCANGTKSYRFDGERWLTRRTRGGGQWGITQDDLGRVFFNNNSDPLRGDMFSSHYVARQPGRMSATGYNIRLVDEFRVWPSRVTPGVNRGYRQGLLKEGKLTTFTGACSPWILRGDGLGEELQGDAFVCEPCGNLVKRYRMEPRPGGALAATDAYAGREFLTSTEERFRPVALADGPDGTLIVVDMYRGVIQHRLFVTSFLRKQVIERGLELPTGLGRIWRVRRKGTRPARVEGLADASWTEVVGRLGHPNGFWRDQAQRLLVEEGGDDEDALELTATALFEAPQPLARLHALWALEGMGALRREHVDRALADVDERVRESAVRCAEPFLDRPASNGARGLDLFETLSRIGREGTERERLQVLYSLGEGVRPEPRRLLRDLARDDASTKERRTAIVSSLAGRELAFLLDTLAEPEWQEPRPGRAELWKALAASVTREGRGEPIARLIDRCGESTEPAPWKRPVVEGILSQRGKGPDGGPGFVDVPHEPAGLAGLLAIEDVELREKAVELTGALFWPDRADVEREDVRALTEAELARFEEGKRVYAMICAQCHLVSGRGEDGRAPSLRGTEWVLGRADRLAALVLAGLNGPVEVDGTTWSQDMPAWGATNEELAAVLTYVRREWGNGAEPVTLDDVEDGRMEAEDRVQPWTALELRDAFTED